MTDQQRRDGPLERVRELRAVFRDAHRHGDHERAEAAVRETSAVVETYLREEREVNRRERPPAEERGRPPIERPVGKREPRAAIQRRAGRFGAA